MLCDQTRAIGIHEVAASARDTLIRAPSRKPTRGGMVTAFVLVSEAIISVWLVTRTRFTAAAAAGGGRMRLQRKIVTARLAIGRAAGTALGSIGVQSVKIVYVVTTAAGRRTSGGTA